MTQQQGERRHFGTVCPEVKAGFGEAIPNKHFYDFPARENHKNFKCAYTLELLATFSENLRLAFESLAGCGFAEFRPARWEYCVCYHKVAVYYQSSMIEMIL